MPNVIVVVLGDVGRSPRMQYHAQSFLKEGFNVTLVGYGGSKPLESITSHEKSTIKYLWETPAFIKNFHILAAYFFKILWQMIALSWILFTSQTPQYLLVQTPPAIPALGVCWIYCRLIGSKFVIDYHNYGFSIMALTHGQQNKIVKISEFLEGFFGRRADGCLCVTKAMKEDLMRRWSIRAVTLYDRPPEHFGSVTPEEKETLMEKYPELSPLRSGRRPALLVSSTSWTEDEDFSTLLSALKDYDNSKRELPKLMCVITGKGPLKERYLAEVESLPWSRVTVTSVWLEPEDYPRLLASADLGVSLHTSSSGLDLPMKVVDMFGCGLPVAAFHFSCLGELVQHQETGLVFHDSKELSGQLQDWFKDFPDQSLRDQYKGPIERFQSLRWHDNWIVQASHIFKQ